MNPATDRNYLDKAYPTDVMPPQSSANNESLLDQIVDEITRKLQQGESVSLEPYLERHPEQAGSLRQIWLGMQLLAELGNSQDAAEVSAAVGPGSSVDPARHQLGDFRILRQAGRGGMGVVYEAEELSLGRRVALKVLPQVGLLDQRQLQRFRNEARAAAGLHHAHIVPVYSVGCDRGVHYYAMQFIDGSSLAELIVEMRRQSNSLRSGPLATEPAHWAATGPACRGEAVNQGQTTAVLASPQLASPQPASPQPASPLPESLEAEQAEYVTRLRAADRTDRVYGDAEWFRSVARMGIQLAEALEYAHSLGVVHRDIKPANIMLDSSGATWITDFGLAQLESDAGLTKTGDVLGTLRYMSPEQARGQHGAIDHRSDIYSLGLTLYELLTLRPAFTAPERHKILRDVLDQEPPWPRQLDPSIPRDLETIVLKAIAKEPQERYPTAQMLSDDLRRFLEYEPILAKPPGWLDRVARLSRRHRRAAVLMVAGLLMAVLGLSTTTIIVLHAKQQTEQALAAVAEQREVAQQKAEDAERAADEKQAVLSFIVDELLGSAAPEKALGRKLTVEEVLANAEEAIDGSFPDQPLVEAAVRHTLGVTHHRLGILEIAERHLRQAVELRASSLGRDHAETLESVNRLALVRMDQGEFQEARTLHEEVLEARRQTLGEEHRDTLKSRSNLAWTLHRLSDDPEALSMLRKAVEAKRRVLGEGDHDTLASVANLAVMVARHGDVHEARALLEEVVEIRGRTLGQQHPSTLSAMNNLAHLLYELGELPEALAIQRQVLEIRRQIQGEEHPETLTTREHLATTLSALGQRAEARRQYEQVLEVRRRSLGNDHPATLSSMYNLAELLKKLDIMAESQQLHEEALAGRERRLGDGHIDTIGSMHALASVLHDQGDWARARAFHARALEARLPLSPHDLDVAVHSVRCEGWLYLRRWILSFPQGAALKVPLRKRSMGGNRHFGGCGSELLKRKGKPRPETI